jgi:HK97 family phage major capsid protein
MDSLEKLRSEFRETLTKANVKAAEWEGKEKEMPAEVASEISSLIREAEAIKAKVDMLKKKQELDVYAMEGTGPKTTQTPAPEAKQSGPFKSLGEQLVAIANAGKPAGKTDPRLYEVKAAGLAESAEGAYLLQPEFSQEIFRKAFDSGQILSRVKKIPTTKNAVKLPALVESSRADGSRWGGIQAYWAAEAAEKTKSKPSFNNISLELKKLIGLCYVTDEMLQDLPVLQTLIADLFTEEFTFQLEESIINGAGSTQPMGVLNAPATVIVSKEGSQSGGKILYANIVKMWSRMYARSRLNAVWFINQDVEPQLYSMVLEGTSSSVPVYLPANGLAGSPYGTLMGRPVIPTEHNPTLGSKGDILLADLSQYAAIDAGNIKSDVSIHVNFIYDETAYRFVYRFDGAPLWLAAVTPFKGSNTISPFVVLEGGH